MSVSAAVHFVRIAASRSRIEPREPTVGFTIVTDRPFAEVFVASSPDLLDEANAGKRTPANWFASRAHGLLQGPGELAYMLPAAFVASAVKEVPRPSRLYYVAAAYTSGAAADPVWSTPRETWAQSLPYVEVAPDLQASAIASTLGVALGRLARSVAPHAPSSSFGDVSLATAFAPVPPVAPAPPDAQVAWRHQATGTLGAPRVVRGAEVSAFGGGTDDLGRDEANPEPYAPAAVAAYDDGYDDGYGPTESAAAYGLESTFPAGAAKPDDLPDSDDTDHAYGDEAAWLTSRPTRRR